MDGLMMKYFVLKPRGDDPHALASREAMRAYAKSIDDVNPGLARELKTWVTREAMAAKSGDHT